MLEIYSNWRWLNCSNSIVLRLFKRILEGLYAKKITNSLKYLLVELDHQSMLSKKDGNLEK